MQYRLQNFLDERSTDCWSISLKIAKMSAPASLICCARRHTDIDGSTGPADQGHGPIECGASNQAANSVAVIDGIAVAMGDSSGSGRGMVGTHCVTWA